MMSIRFLPVRRWALALALASFGAAATGQTAGTGPVLKGNAVTEDALTRALTPPADDGTRSRSLRIAVGEQQRLKPQRRAEEPSPPSGQAASGTGAASLLITFETNASAISPASIPALDKLGRALKGEKLSSFKFDVEGHADPRGNADANLKLSQERAESVVEYLVSKHGIDSQRLRPVGKGDRELANPRHPAAPENRRVTIRNQAG